MVGRADKNLKPVDFAAKSEGRKMTETKYWKDESKQVQRLLKVDH